jgi:threonine/homoserine/homoserine lactone efflux protein
MLDRLMTFAAVSTLTVVTPGPDSLLVLRATLRRGRRQGFHTACGAAAGSLGWGLTSAAGLAAVLAASAQLYHVIQLVGAAYLILLGIQSWRATDRPALDAGQFARPDHRQGRAFTAGLLSDLLTRRSGCSSWPSCPNSSLGMDP